MSHYKRRLQRRCYWTVYWTVATLQSAPLLWTNSSDFNCSSRDIYIL